MALATAATFRGRLPSQRSLDYSLQRPEQGGRQAAILRSRGGFARDVSAVTEASRKGRLRQIQAAATMALRHREAIQNGDFSVFRMAFVFAIAKDLSLIHISE